MVSSLASFSFSLSPGLSAVTYCRSSAWIHFESRSGAPMNLISTAFPIPFMLSTSTTFAKNGPPEASRSDLPSSPRIRTTSSIFNGPCVVCGTAAGDADATPGVAACVGVIVGTAAAPVVRASASSLSIAILASFIWVLAMCFELIIDRV